MIFVDGVFDYFGVKSLHEEGKRVQYQIGCSWPESRNRALALTGVGQCAYCFVPALTPMSGLHHKCELASACILDLPLYSTHFAHPRISEL